jgi:hypothetical protein
LTTAATAVVLEPFESSMTDTRNGPKNAARTAEELFARHHICAADEDGGLVQILRSSREDGAVHEVANRVCRDATVAHHFVRAAIERDDAIKYAWVTRGVELQQKFAHGTAGAGCRRRSPHQRIRETQDRGTPRPI